MPEASNQIGTVTIAYGTATAEGPDGIRTLNAESPVYEDDVIKTSGHGSAVEIELRDGAVLSQGPDSSIVLDSYVYNPDQSMGEMTVKIIQGTLRSVTGEIVDMNPEGFRIESPLATIGIRGTTTGHVVPADGGEEQHVCVDFVERAVVVTQSDGSLRLMTQDGLGVTASAEGLGEVAPAPANILANLEQLSPASLEQGAPSYSEDPGQEEDQTDDVGGAQDAAAGGEAQGQAQGEGQGEAPGEAPEPMSLDSVEATGGQVVPPPTPMPAMAPVAQAVDVSPAPTESEADTGDGTERTTIEDTDETTESTTPSASSLDLSAETDDLTVDLSASPAYWQVTGSPATRIDVDNAVGNVTGSSTGENILTGNDSDNVLRGGANADTIDGGLGDDTIFGNGGGDDLDGGADGDTVSYATLSTGVDVDLAAGTADYTISATPYTDTLANFENVAGSDYDDVLQGTGGDNILWGNQGDDALWGDGGNDTLYGGAGDDTISYQNATGGVTADLDGTVSNDGFGDTDTISGFENFVGSNYADNITTSDEATSVETIQTGSGNDTINYEGNLYGNSVTMDAGTGDDRLVLNADVIAGTTFEGGTGTNTIEASSGGTVDATELSVTNMEALQVSGSSTLKLSADTVSGQFWSTSVAAGSTLEVIGTTNVDSVNMAGLSFASLAGSVSISALSGNDSVAMGGNMSSSFTIDGGSGDDTLSFTDTGLGADDLDNVTNVEHFVLGDADTSITAVNTMVNGGSTAYVDASAITSGHTFTWDGSAEFDGSYHFLAGAGVNDITGGFGDDTFSLSDDMAATSSFVGNGGTNQLSIDATLSVDATATLANFQELSLAEDVTLTVDWGKESFLTGLSDVYGHSGGGDETLSIVDSGGNDSLNLSSTPTFNDWSGNDAISVEGLVGDDIIILWDQATKADGGNGDDNIFGGAGNDTLLGDNGDDYLRGGEGSDALTGGHGSDTFHYQTTSEVGDTISDFTHGDDVMQFVASNFGSLGTGTLNAANFAEISDSDYLSDGYSGLSSADEHFVYYNDGSTFALYYDADGSGGSDHTLVASFDSDVNLTETDITLA